MSNFLDDVGDRLKFILEKVGMTTPEEVIIASETDFLNEGCTEQDVRKLKEAAAKLIAPKVASVSDLLSPKWCTKWSRISFGCPSLDRCSGGGIVTRGITEICGKAGSGKTQILLQLSLTVQLPCELGGLGKSVVYICTEGPFPSKRLFQMAKVYAERYPDQQINYMGNVYVDHPLDSESLLKCVTVRLPTLLETINIGLILIDSVAAVYRVYSDYDLRDKHLRQMAHSLLGYADKYSCGVVCVNQMSSVINKDGHEHKKLVPSLGAAWSNLGRTRIQISKVPKQSNFNSQALTIRKFEILFAPETPNESAEFLITNDGGVVDVPPTH